MTRHPGDEKLVAWLESGHPRRVGRHVEGCEACMARVEVVTDLDRGLLAELVSANSPPADLHLRTADRVQDRLAAEEALACLLDLFSVPWRMAEALLDPHPAPTRPIDTRPIDPRPARPEPAHPEERSDG